MNIPGLRLQKSAVDEVIADLDEAIETKPQDAQGHIQRGYLHFFRGDYDQAAVDFDMATHLRPADEHLKQSLKQLGRVLGVSG